MGRPKKSRSIFSEPVAMDKARRSGFLVTANVDMATVYLQQQIKIHQPNSNDGEKIFNGIFASAER